MTETVPPAFDEYCIVELMGHRRVAARVTQAVFPAGFLRLDEPGGRTQIVSPSSVYAIHPTTEAIVAAMAERWRDEPIARYELEAAHLVSSQGKPDPWDVTDDDDDLGDDEGDPF